MNTFESYVPKFQNRGIHFMLAEIIKFRKQLTTRPEFKSQSGWHDALNAYMVEELEKLSDTLESITYKPSTKTKEELEAEAADTTRTLAADYNPDSLTVDNTLTPALKDYEVVWVLDGSDPDLPQPSVALYPNDNARSFITQLDELFVQMTRLDSRNQPFTISKQESVMMRTFLDALYTICQRKGGEVNKSDIPTGTLPTQEPGTLSS